MPWKVWRRSLLVMGALGAIGVLVARLALKQHGFLAGMVALSAVAIGLLLAWMLLPDVDGPGRTLRRGARGRGRIALTFDDGPNGVQTAAVLDVLARHRARATFFCVGEAALAHPELLRRMANEGHCIGNHTMTHALLPRLRRRQTVREVEAAQAAITAAGVAPPLLFRAPKGWKNPFLPGVLREQGLRLIGWTRGVWDTDRPGIDIILRRSRRALRDGAIVLLHDGLPGADRLQTVMALEGILRECHRRGLSPVTVPELMT